MRRAFVFVVVGLLLPACFPPTTSGGQGAGSVAGSGAGGSTASGTVHGCDSQNDCNSCVMCADGSACGAQYTTCNNNAACVGLAQCLGTCGADTDCQQGCYLGNAPGTSDYDAWTRCRLCTSCPTKCAGVRSCK